MEVNNLVPLDIRDKHKDLMDEFFKRDSSVQFYDREVLALDKTNSET